MAFGSKLRLPGEVLLAVASTVALLWFATGLFPKWPLLWFAPLPILLFAPRNSLRSAAIAAMLAWLAASLNLLHYFRVLHLPIPVQFEIFVIPALIFTGAVLLFRSLLLRGARWSAMLAFPSAWVSFEYLLSLGSPHGTAGNLAYTQLNFLPVLQLASLTGPWGISFVVFLFSSAIAVGLYGRDRLPALRTMGTGLAVVMAVLIFGAVRLLVPVSGETIKVGLIASDKPGNTDVADDGADTARLLRDYALAAEGLAARGAQIIVFPEKLVVVVDPRTKDTDAFLQALADKTRATIVAGVIRVSPKVKYNEARVYTPGAALRTYDKHHMLPPFESNLEPGSTLTFLPDSTSRGVQICKDMDFTRLSRQYGQACAGLMLVPAWDFVLDRWLHGHIALMRGVEDGFSIARAARQGYLTVSDDRGRVLAEIQSNSAPFTTLIADVPVTHHNTLYLLLGDWFAWLCLAIFAITLGQLWRSRRTRSTERDLRSERLPAVKVVR